MQITVTGRSAHGGRPWLGVNAISKMARILAALEDELVPSLASRTHPLLPAPTINMGTVTGGTKFNLVADRAVLEVDRRMVPGETAEQALDEVRALCQRLRDADAQSWEFEVMPVMHVTPGEIDPHAPIVKACQAAHRAVTGEEAVIAATAGFEDAHFLLDAGIPTAMFGPYRPAAPPPPASAGAGGAQRDGFFTNSGMADESVDLVDVARAARVYARLIRDLIG
jgi:acetylornithine deacetylase/succinyl-diaminopimelate desuccinylase-like protein